MLALTQRDLDPGEQLLAGKHICSSLSQSQLNLKKSTHLLRFPMRNGRLKKVEGSVLGPLLVGQSLSEHPSLRFRVVSGTGEDRVVKARKAKEASSR